MKLLQRCRINASSQDHAVLLSRSLFYYLGDEEQNSNFKNLGSMEKLLKPCDKECLKMAILTQEQTFREQVYELHRLYQTQKTLMRNIERSRPNGQSQDRWNQKKATSLNQIHEIHQRPRQNLDLERPAEEDINVESDGNEVLEIEDESETELTLGPTSYYRRRKAETPLTSDSGPSFSSSSTGSNHIKRTSRSSRIHQRSTVDTTREELTGQKWGLVDSSGVEEQLRQDKLNHGQPPWLFQVLRLNMT